MTPFNLQSQIQNLKPIRPRRLRLNPQLRAMVRETHLAPDDFIYPLFVAHGRGVACWAYSSVLYDRNQGLTSKTR